MSSLAQRVEPAAPMGAQARAIIDVHALSIPARAFTGDFYLVDDTRRPLSLVVGDVAGKGIGAAVIMAMLQEELEGRLARCHTLWPDPAATLSALHAFLKSVLPGNRFATAIAVMIDAAGRMVVANAGHCPLLIARLDGSVEALASTGPVLGLIEGSWGCVVTELRRGEALVAYSDGVIEAENGEGEEFGTTRLISAFARHARCGSSASAVATAVEREVRRFAHGRTDDVTLVVARRA